MQLETMRQHEARYYTAYAEELRERFAEGLLPELQAYPQFVVWRHEQLDGKPKKPPYNPKAHRYADIQDPRSWGTLDQALQALRTGRYNGIGFVFSDTDPFSMIDLDHCVGNNGTIDAWAQAIIAQMQTYTEYSPLDGIHLITQLEAPLPGPGRKIGPVEMYSTRHFMTLTTRHVPGTATTIEKRLSEQSSLYVSLAPESVLSHWQNTRGVARPTWQAEPTPDDAADQQVLEKALQAANGEKFRRYWYGDPTLWEGPGAERRSKSDADFVLILYLLSWTGDNLEQVKRLFRQSGLYDSDKTDRITGKDRESGRPVTYLETTIYNALRKRQSSKDHPRPR